MTPVAVAKTERIQKLSWQKLQYWMMARMVAQQRNMVTWRKRGRHEWALKVNLVVLTLVNKNKFWNTDWPRPERQMKTFQNHQGKSKPKLNLRLTLHLAQYIFNKAQNGEQTNLYLYCNSSIFRVFWGLFKWHLKWHRFITKRPQKVRSRPGFSKKLYVVKG